MKSIKELLQVEWEWWNETHGNICLDTVTMKNQYRSERMNDSWLASYVLKGLELANLPWLEE